MFSIVSASPSFVARLRSEWPTTHVAQHLARRLLQGDPQVVDGMAALGLGPFDPLFLDQGNPTLPPAGVTPWQLAMAAPTDAALKRMVPAVTSMLRAAGPQGRATVVHGWQTHGWGWPEALLSGSAERVTWLYTHLLDWTIGAGGDWSEDFLAPWLSAWPRSSDPYLEYDIPTVHIPKTWHPQPLIGFHMKAVLHAALKTGDAAAWALPVLQRCFGRQVGTISPWDWTIEDYRQDDDLDSADSSEQRVIVRSLLHGAMERQAFRLAQALMEQGAQPFVALPIAPFNGPLHPVDAAWSSRVPLLSLSARFLFGPFGPSCFDSDLPLTLCDLLVALLDNPQIDLTEPVLDLSVELSGAAPPTESPQTFMASGWPTPRFDRNRPLYWLHQRPAAKGQPVSVEHALTLWLERPFETYAEPLTQTLRAALQRRQLRNVATTGAAPALSVRPRL